MCRLAVFALLAVAAVSVYGQGQDDVPPFLKTASPAQLNAFQQLIQNNGHLTQAALDAKVTAWAAQQGGAIASGFSQFQAQLKASEAQGEAAHQAAIAKFSPAAKKADADLTAISNDRSLGVQAKGEKIQAYYQSLPANVRAELEKAQGGR